MRIGKFGFILFWLLNCCVRGFSSVVFASDSDCNLVSADIVDWRAGADSLYSNLYPSEARIQALINLKAYCCEHDSTMINSDNCKNAVFLYSYPESPYLLDHLIDVGLRRLDASAMYGLDPDMDGQKWRTYIRKASTDADGNFASSIEKEYKKYWSLDNNKYQLWFETIDEVRSLLNSKDYSSLLWLNEIYEDATLYQKYVEQCGIAYLLYIDVPSYNKPLLAFEDKFLTCQKLVANRIVNELTYTKNLVLQKSTKLLTDNIHVYLYDYFSKNRLINLQETIFSISDLFTTLAKSFPWWTSECN